MSQIQSIETAVLTALSQSLPELAVEPFPEKPDEYELLHPLGAVLVQYDGSEFSSNNIAGAVGQQRRARFSVVVLVRSIRGNSGCYRVLEQVSGVLLGLRLPGMLSGATIVQEDFMSEADGVWAYVQRYEFRVWHLVPNHS